MNEWVFWYNIYLDKVMTLQQFQALPKEDREDVLLNNAVLLESIQDDEHTYTLFQIDGFYLEVLRNGDEVVVDSISYFEETELLEPYLALISLSPVYNILNNYKIR